MKQKTQDDKKTIKAPMPPNEEFRLSRLRSYSILDTSPDGRFDDIVEEVCRLIRVPMSTISLVDAERQWFKARRGVASCETSRDVSFCAHTIMTPEIMIVEDAALDSRFSDSPLVVEDPFIRFYMGQPITTYDGANLGALCAMDTEPRVPTWHDIKTMQFLARQVMFHIEYGLLAKRLIENEKKCA